MAVSIAGLRRNIKNVAHNYTDAQVGSHMREISDYDLCHDVILLGQSQRSHKQRPMGTLEYADV